MKINISWELFFMKNSTFKDLFRIMRICLLFLFGFTFQLVAVNTRAQDAFIELKNKSVTVGQLIAEVEKQTDYLVVYSNREVDTERKINFGRKSDKVSSFLNEAFADTDIGYDFENNYVILSKKSRSNAVSFAHLIESVQQERKTVVGKVSDEKGEPIIGATVVEKANPSHGTITDADGNFTLANTPSTATLQITYVGMKTREIVLNGERSIHVLLEPDIELLEELVVVGYGVQKKVNLTGAVSSVSVKEVSKRQVSNTSVALQGLVPGLSVIQRGGSPSDAAGLRIRGYTTLGNVTPLILVDGIEMGIDNIDPSIIESISVLKDAASASIYGNRASAGVILITTKRAATEQVRISYNGFIGQQKVLAYPKNVGAVEHMELLSEAQRNVGITPTFSDDYIKKYKENLGKNNDIYPDTDWYKEILTNSGFMQSHTLSVSGGTKKVSVLATVGHLEQKGVIENVEKRRSFIRINSDIQVGNRLRTKFDAHISQTTFQQPTRSSSDAFHWAMRIPANKPAILSNGKWGEGWNGDNPVAFTNQGGIAQEQSPSVTLNLGLEYNLADWIKMKFSYSPNYWKSYQTALTLPVESFYPDGTKAYVSPQRNNLWNMYNQNRIHQSNAWIDMQKEMGEHSIASIVGFQQEDFRNDGFDGRRKDFVFPSFPVLSGGSSEDQRTYGWASDWAMRSFFGRINYIFKNRYLFEANARYDGSSRFAKGHKWGLFPSVSAGWRISEEPFWKLKDSISDWKIRASYGRLGNQLIGNYPFASTIALWPSYAFDGKPVNGAAVTTLPNTEISWEQTTVSNIGMDMYFLKYFSFTADLYKKRTTGILLTLDVPLVIGMDAPVQNAGIVSNKGWEINLRYENNDNPFKYRIGFNLSDVVNKIEDIKGLKNDDLLVNNEGHAMNSFLLYEAVGYITQEDYDSGGNYLHAKQFGNYGPGDIRYKDINKDGEITLEDKKIWGNTIPRYTYGIDCGFSYKGVDFGMIWQGVGKANGYLYGQSIMPFVEGGTLQEQHKNRWTPQTPNALFPRLTFNEINNTQNSTFWLKDASYLKLRNLQIGYTFAEKIVRPLGLNAVRVYLSGENLLSITRFWKGFDPESPVGNGAYYPHVRTLSCGLNINL